MASLGDRIAANVRGERARRRWTQADLAERMGPGWSRATVSDLESGRRKVAADDLAPLCGAFGVRFADLVRDAEAADLERLQL
jgi:transcriptional regulator with XRE-family HTH domain